MTRHGFILYNSILSWGKVSGVVGVDQRLEFAWWLITHKAIHLWLKNQPAYNLRHHLMAVQRMSYTSITLRNHIDVQGCQVAQPNNSWHMFDDGMQNLLTSSLVLDWAYLVIEEDSRQCYGILCILTCQTTCIVPDPNATRQMSVMLYDTFVNPRVLLHICWSNKPSPATIITSSLKSVHAHFHL